MLLVIMVSTKSILSERIKQKSFFSGFTPLLKSLQIGNEKIAQILIENGANVNATNDDGDSALNLAALSSKYQF